MHIRLEDYKSSPHVVLARAVDSVSLSVTSHCSPLSSFFASISSSASCFPVRMS